MPSHGKKYIASRAKVGSEPLRLPQAVGTVRSASYAKFDETVEICMRLGVNPKHADQMVRGTVVLPHGTGTSKRVLVIAGGEKQKEAEAAGADHVGGAELVKKIQEGWLEFDAVIATPDMMREVGKLGKVLGPRGLMPNPKTGTVTFEVAQAVGEVKAGKVEFRVDKTAIVHVPLGKLSFQDTQLVDNANALIHAVLRAKPAAAKGKYVRSVYLSSTMGPGVPVDTSDVEAVI
jgi:large subunit ribosomal protein L1